MRPLVTLLDDPDGSGPLPAPLAEAYGGGLALASDLVYANFVTSLDGVAAIGTRRGSGSAISGRNQADRFVMGLLRSLADAVLVGAGTLRADGGQSWSPARLAPEFTAAYGLLGRPQARLVVVTASGAVDPQDPALAEGALVLSTETGAGRLRGRLPAGCEVRDLPGDDMSGRRILAAIREAGHRRVLAEGGPHLLAGLVAEGVLGELFLTLAPVLAGRSGAESRYGLLEGVALAPEAFARATLLSVKTAGSHLFLRYSMSGSTTPAPSRSGAE